MQEPKQQMDDALWPVLSGDFREKSPGLARVAKYRGGGTAAWWNRWHLHAGSWWPRGVCG